MGLSDGAWWVWCRCSRCGGGGFHPGLWLVGTHCVVCQGRGFVR